MTPTFTLGCPVPTGPVELPDTLSALIRIAHKDLLAVEAKPEKYVVEMSDWMVQDKKTGVCEVCLGGSVLAGTLGIDLSVTGHHPEFNWRGDEYMSADLFTLEKTNVISRTTRYKLHALDWVRQGPDELMSALEELDPEIALPDDFVFPAFEEYEDDPVVFKAYLLDLATSLEAVGL